MAPTLQSCGSLPITPPPSPTDEADAGLALVPTVRQLALTPVVTPAPRAAAPSLPWLPALPPDAPAPASPRPLPAADSERAPRPASARATRSAGSITYAGFTPYPTVTGARAPAAASVQSWRVHHDWHSPRLHWLQHYLPPAPAYAFGKPRVRTDLVGPADELLTSIDAWAQRARSAPRLPRAHDASRHLVNVAGPLARLPQTKVLRVAQQRLSHAALPLRQMVGHFSVYDAASRATKAASLADVARVATDNVAVAMDELNLMARPGFAHALLGDLMRHDSLSLSYAGRDLDLAAQAPDQSFFLLESCTPYAAYVQVGLLYGGPRTYATLSGAGAGRSHDLNGATYVGVRLSVNFAALARTRAHGPRTTDVWLVSNAQGR